jgi:hypothetical protein
MIYSESVTIHKIVSLPYFDNFKTVEVLHPLIKFPKQVKAVWLYIHQNIPTSVTHLTIFFNQPMHFIPPSVTHLAFGCIFNQPIKNLIPCFVTHLTFGKCFNHPIESYIPKSVTHLKFGFYFDHPIDGLHDETIKEITLSSAYRKKIDQKLLTKIIIDNWV